MKNQNMYTILTTSFMVEHWIKITFFYSALCFDIKCSCICVCPGRKIIFLADEKKACFFWEYSRVRGEQDLNHTSFFSLSSWHLRRGQCSDHMLDFIPPLNWLIISRVSKHIWWYNQTQLFGTHLTCVKTGKSNDTITNKNV